MGAQGTATLDFGASPSRETSVVVTGEAAIEADSHAEGFWMADATGDNDEDAHEHMADHCRLVVTDVIAGTGFTIKATLLSGLATGEFSVRWVWN